MKVFHLESADDANRARLRQQVGEALQASPLALSAVCEGPGFRYLAAWRELLEALRAGMDPRCACEIVVINPEARALAKTAGFGLIASIRSE